MMVLETAIRFEVIECITCGVMFGMSPTLQQQKRKSKDWFYCPNGHPQAYTKSPEDAEIERLKKELADKDVRLNWARSDAEHAKKNAQEVQRKLIATKGVLTRTRRRVGTGMCPCCGLGFTDLHQHMKERHPDYKNPLPEPEKSND
jgi:hypothetical protein